MKRWLSLILALMLLVGCSKDTTDSVPGSTLQHTEFVTEQWVQQEQLKAVVLCAASDGDGGVWILNSENTLVHYSSALDKLTEIVLSDQLSAITCFDGVLYGMGQDDSNGIYFVHMDGSLEKSCSIDDTALNGRFISDFCRSDGGWLLRLNDTSSMLVDGQGNMISILEDIATTSICAVQEGAVVLAYNFSEGQYIPYTTKAKVFTTGEPIELQEGDDVYKLQWSNDAIIVYGNSRVFQWEDSQIVPICSYVALGNTILVSHSEGNLLVVTEQGIFLFRPMEDAEKYIMDEQNNTNVCLTLATLFNGYCQDEYIKQAVAAFNSMHQEVTIVIKDYLQGNDTYLEAMEQLNLDIASGNGPDIIDTAAFPADVYIGNGTLLPLGDRIQEIDMETYHPNLVTALTVENDVYFVMVGYHLQVVAADNSVLSSVENGWSLTEFSDLMDSDLLPDNYCLWYSDSKQFLSDWCDSCIADYIQGSSCSFDSESFVHLLKIANRLSVVDYEAFDYSAAWIDSIFCVDGFRGSDRIKEGVPSTHRDTTYIGMPSDVSSGVAFDQKISMGISAQSLYPDQCWSFIKYLLGEEFQTSIVEAMLPVYSGVLSEEIENQKSYADCPLSDARATELERIIEKTDHLYRVYLELKDIVMEEAEAYFSGDKTAEETARLIQNRASIYLSERE